MHENEQERKIPNCKFCGSAIDADAVFYSGCVKLTSFLRLLKGF